MCPFLNFSLSHRSEIGDLGDLVEKKLERNNCSTETVHILPHHCKAKMRLRDDVRFFQFSNISAVHDNNSQLTSTASETHIWPNHLVRVSNLLGPVSTYVF